MDCICSVSVCVSADAFDMDLLVDTLQKLKEGKHVEIPIYDFSTHAHAKYKVLYIPTVNVLVLVCVRKTRNKGQCSQNCLLFRDLTVYITVLKTHTHKCVTSVCLSACLCVCLLLSAAAYNVRSQRGRFRRYNGVLPRTSSKTHGPQNLRRH